MEEERNLNIFREFIQKRGVKSLDQVVLEAERLEIKDQAVFVLCELLLGRKRDIKNRDQDVIDGNQEIDFIQDIIENETIFFRFTRNNRKAQLNLLCALEQKIKTFPYTLEVLYETDIVEEEVLKDWLQPRREIQAVQRLFDENVENLNTFREFIRRRGVKSLSQVTLEAERLEIKDHQAVSVLCELLLGEHTVIQDIKNNRTLFLRFTRYSRNVQLKFLRALEQKIETYKDSLMPQVPSILRLLYETDIVEEEVLKDWSLQDEPREIHKAAEDFVQWLFEEDEEEDDEE